ncbi:Hypothetical protein, putative [Bodo saltans]|uniref:Uncharacterized protein n=1 Tax=Bodo saltans TaxID=75058 RepID=A0A0S4JGB5_BODSA|nr:Hypothetical protein, putative [Bodo saltans]|eukprot:CUG89360.1 Hypothetical protein, putative [Bodo saltans]
MEAFRRCELKLLSAGEEELHAGWGGLQRRRKYQGVGVAPWRCIPPSKGTHEENVGASIEEPHSHFAPLLTDASTLCSASNLTLRGMLPLSSPLESRHHDSPPPTSPTTNNNNSLASRPLAVVYEACRSAHAWGDGAWDVFVRDAGVTRGLFTHNLCTIIEGEMMGGDSPGGGHTTGRREAGTTSNNKLQPPPPSLRGGVPLLWFELHERMLRSIEETSYRQAPRLWVGSGDALTAPVALNSLRYGIDEEHSP